MSFWNSWESEKSPFAVQITELINCAREADKGSVRSLVQTSININ